MSKPLGVGLAISEAGLCRLELRGGERRFQLRVIDRALTDPVGGETGRSDVAAPTDDDVPIAVIVSDGAVLYRRLTLPPTDEPTLRQAIEAQAEALLPLPSEQLAWCWRNVGGASAEAQGRSVLLCVTRQSAVEQARPTDAADDLPVVPSGLALGAALEQWGAPASGVVLAVDLGPWHTTLLLLSAHGVETCATIAGGAADWVEAAASASEISAETVNQHLTNGQALPEPATEALSRVLAAWSRQIRERYDHCLTELPDLPAPSRCLLLGAGSVGPQVEDATARTFELPISRPQNDALEVETETDANSEHTLNDLMPLAGAAGLAAARRAEQVALRCGDTGPAAGGDRPRYRRLAGLAGWAAVMVAALFALDLLKARQVTDRLERVQAKIARTEQNRASLAQGRYLQQRTLPPLLVLDALAEAVPRETILTGWNYEVQGRMRISGNAPGIQALDELLKGLADSPAFEQVVLRRASEADRKWQFRIEAALPPLSRFDRQSRQPPAKPDAEAPTEMARSSNGHR